MIIWLASYPKSGNTLIRLMLSSYFFSNDGKCNFKLVKNIKQFPHGGLFLKMGIDLKDQNEVIKNYIKAQEIINKTGSVQFLKTHSHLFNFNQKYSFTNFENSIGVIYIVRDPRNVVTSFSKYLDLSVDETSNFMINGSGDGLSWTSTWSNNFQYTLICLLLPIITFVVTKVISNNIALSLGMVGALSIVRFRNPVKNS